MRPIVRSAALVCLLSSTAAALGQTTAEIAANVSQSTYSVYLNDKLFTHAGQNRYFSAQHDQARTNIYDLFTGFGLETSLAPFVYSSTTYYNVVGEHRGAVRPRDIYIVGAHFDSVNGPGADDNASGVAGILEAARVLSQYTFEATVRFVAFDREEQGLYGSNAYAAAHAGENIQGMISLDMIGYNPAGVHHDRAMIYGHAPAAPLKADLAAALATYGIAAEIGGELDASDHAPFETTAGQACLLIEHAMRDWGNPYYHTVNDSVDTPGYIDYAYATTLTRGTVDFLAGRLAAVPEPGTIVMLVSGGGVLGVLAWRRRRRPGAPDGSLMPPGLLDADLRRAPAVQ